MATKSVKQAQQETPEVRTITVTKVVTIPMFKKCAAHGENFPEEDTLRPISEFWGKVPGSYCKRCASLKHKANRQADYARRQRERTGYQEFKALKAEFEAWKAAHKSAAQ